MTTPTPAPLTGQMRAEFSLVRHARQFVDHLTNGDSRSAGGPAGWRYVPDTLKRDGKIVTWQWSGDLNDRRRYSEYLGDMVMTVGSFGTSPDGTHRAYLNGQRGPAEW